MPPGDTNDQPRLRTTKARGLAPGLVPGSIWICYTGSLTCLFWKWFLHFLYLTTVLLCWGQELYRWNWHLWPKVSMLWWGSWKRKQTVSYFIAVPGKVCSFVVRSECFLLQKLLAPSTETVCCQNCTKNEPFIPGPLDSSPSTCN